MLSAADGGTSTSGKGSLSTDSVSVDAVFAAEVVDSGAAVVDSPAVVVDSVAMVVDSVAVVVTSPVVVVNSIPVVVDSASVVGRSPAGVVVCWTLFLHLLTMTNLHLKRRRILVLRSVV